MAIKPVGLSFTTSAQQIINAASQDLRFQLGSTGPDAAILLDYVNRVHLHIIRRTRWPFSLSPVQSFITALEQNDYWLGPIGQGPAGVEDTGLNIPSIFRIKSDSVFDRTNNRQLGKITDPPNTSMTQFPTGFSRPGLPSAFINDSTTPNLISIYPAPNNQSNFTPVPPSPICTHEPNGTQAARIYYVRATFTDSNGGEGVASDTSTRVFLPVNNVMVVQSPNLPFTTPAAGVIYTGYNVYASTTQGSETLQNASPITLGQPWTEPNTGLVAGVNFPKTSTLEPMYGYLIDFRYYPGRTQIINPNQMLAIPDDYKDVIIAGVLILGYALAERQEWVQFWKSIFEEGITQMISDKNLYFSGNDIILPDPATTAGYGFGNVAIEPLFLP